MTPPPSGDSGVGPRARRAFRLALRRPSTTTSEVDAELALHIALRVEQLVADGWSPGDAEAEARRRFGPSWATAVRELHHSGKLREERLAMRERLDALMHDLRYALRSLTRAPRYAITTVLTLGIGLAAATVVFTLVDHIVLRPLRYVAPEHLVVVRESSSKLADLYPTIPANASHFLEWRRACTACSGIAALKRHALTLTTEGDPRRLGMARVSANLFPLLGVRPALGRGFRDEDELRERDRVVVLSDALWRGQFGADPSIVGRDITLNDQRYRVIGVLARDDGIPGGNALGALVALPAEIDAYMPLALSEQESQSKGDHDYGVIARLKDGATIDEMHAQLDAASRVIAEREGGGLRLEAEVTPLYRQLLGGTRRPMLLLLSAVGMMLMIVCVNLANLSLARSAGRRREAAIRVALGAGAGRLARLALVEMLMIALVGGALGVGLAVWGVQALVALAPATLPRVSEVQLDLRVLATSALLAVSVGLLVGALPALRAGRADPADALKAGGRTATDSRTVNRRRSWFITAQVALSTVLLLGTGLFLRSYLRVMAVDPGVDTNHVIAFDLSLPLTSYPTSTLRQAFNERAIADISRLSGVESVATTTALPLEGETWINDVARAGETTSGDKPLFANYRAVSNDYFRTIGTALKSGRTFNVDDRGRQVAILAERTANTLWPDGSAIGKRILAGNDEAEVIGIAADVRTSTLEEEGGLLVYLPSSEFTRSLGVLLVRTTSPASLDAATAIRAAIRRLDPTVAVPTIRTMEQVVDRTVATRLFQLALFAIFAVLALLTASIGIYGVIAQSLAARTNEIGVRMALGAQASDVHRLVLREGLVPVAVGLLIGVTASLAIGRIVASQLFGIAPGDAPTVVSVAAMLGIVGIIACVVPARRSTGTALDTLLRRE